MNKRQIEYRNYLKSEHWKALRWKVICRDGHKCKRCPNVSFLQAHHLFYRERFEDSIPEDLITLCYGCHQKEHGLPVIFPYFDGKKPKDPLYGWKPKRRSRKERARNRKMTKKQQRLSALLRHVPKLKGLNFTHKKNWVNRGTSSN